MKRHHNTATISPLLASLMCDGVNPVDKAYLQSELLTAYSALDAITKDADPKPEHWNALAHAVDITFELYCRGRMPFAARDDIDGAIAGLAVAGARAQDEDKPIRIPGQLIDRVNGCLEWYAAALPVMPERVIIQATVAVARRKAVVRKFQKDGKKVAPLLAKEQS